MRAVLSALCLVGCMPPQGAALMQQTAQEFNFDLRFGRVDMAVEQVSPKYADSFAKRHRYWGGALHITDAETLGLHMRGPENCDVSVRVAWYRAEEGELHSTIVKQRWHLYKSGWLLDGEVRLDGDIGVLGESVQMLAPDGPAQPAQFPTIRLGSDG